MSEQNILQKWLLNKLETVKEKQFVLVRDPLQLISESDSSLHSFARDNNYTVIIAATNLVFRELFELATAENIEGRLLVIDRVPARRKQTLSTTQAPPPFYPDLMWWIDKDAIINANLQQFLKEYTNDENWTQLVNERSYARLIATHLPEVIIAHRNLRSVDKKRFNDQDFKTIVAFAALGLPESAFRKLKPKELWRIGLLGHEKLSELDDLAPEITKPIREALKKADAPFCWFGLKDSENIIRAFYLSLILSQHLENWSLLLANIDPSLGSYAEIKQEVLTNTAPDLIELDPKQATRDLEAVESSLTRQAIEFILLQQLKIEVPENFAALIEKEHYSKLFRSLGLLLALDNLLSNNPAKDAQKIINQALFTENSEQQFRFANTRESVFWSQLKDGYQLTSKIQSIRADLSAFCRNLKVKNANQLNYAFFREFWNDKKINRLEYYLSALERMIETGELLPRDANQLPDVFTDALIRIKQRVRQIAEETYKQLDEVNQKFQEMVVLQYPDWLTNDGEVHLTSQFLRRCLKPYWDAEKEKAVVFVFDGMRYDIWDELLRPMLEDRMEVLADLPAASLLPSETHLSRWALAAGTEPQFFYPRKAENQHLKDALEREFNYQGEVVPSDPEGSGTGETVRYRAGNLDYYIFEFCDKELHGIQHKELPDGRKVPSRPLAYIYQQHLKNIIDTEVLAIVRRLHPGTKVFITADHGFGRVGRDPIWFNDADLNEKTDCSYLNCWLRVPFDEVSLPSRVKDRVIAFTPQQLRVPAQETRTLKNTGNVFQKDYKAVLFPKVGNSFSRQGAPYRPDVYTHGGISIQELMIPMIALRVRSQDEGTISLEAIDWISEAFEGDEIIFRLRLNRRANKLFDDDQMRVEVEAVYSREPERFSVPKQIIYLPSQNPELVFKIKPSQEEATDDEQRKGEMQRVFNVTASYREGNRTVRKSLTHPFTVKLKSERVVRRLGNLGNILGLTPKGMK